MSLNGRLNQSMDTRGWWALDKTLSERTLCFKPVPVGYSLKATLNFEELEWACEVLTPAAQLLCLMKQFPSSVKTFDIHKNLEFEWGPSSAIATYLAPLDYGFFKLWPYFCADSHEFFASSSKERY